MPASAGHYIASGWTSVEMREDVNYDRAWEAVFSILTREFDLITVLKDDGYIQTGWLYTWSEAYQDNFRVRVTVKFSPDRKILQLRSGA